MTNMNVSRDTNIYKRLMKSHWHLTLLLLIFIVMVNSTIEAASTSGRKRRNGHPESRSVRVMNKSGARIDIFWIHSVTGELAPSHTDNEGVMFGGETGISSYVGHKFEVRELPSKKGKKKCLQDVCRKTYFTVNKKEDQWITIEEDFSITLEDSTSRAHNKAAMALGGCVNITDLQELSECLTKHAELALDKERNDINYQATIRKSMGEQLSDYSCGSFVTSSTTSVSPILLTPVKVKTTPSVRNDTYNNEMVQTLFESDYSNIRLYKNFLTVEDCDQMLQGSKGDSLSIKTKIKRLLDNTNMLPQQDYSSIISDRYTVKIESGPVVVDSSDNATECELQPDGSCRGVEKTLTSDTPAAAAAAVTMTNPPSSPPNNYVVEKIITDDSVAARIILTCVKSSISDNSTTPENKEDDDDDRELSYSSPSGMIYFTKAGVRIVPTHRSAIVIQYNEIDDDDGVTILREDDPFIDQHIVCPITQSNMTVATIMYNITHP